MIAKRLLRVRHKSDAWNKFTPSELNSVGIDRQIGARNSVDSVANNRNIVEGQTLGLAYGTKNQHQKNSSNAKWHSSRQNVLEAEGDACSLKLELLRRSAAHCTCRFCILR